MICLAVLHKVEEVFCLLLIVSAQSPFAKLRIPTRSPLCTVVRLEITVPVGWALNTNN